MWKEFKEFALKGNVVDLAIGVVIGGAFGKIVTSFVSDILTPLLSTLLGKVDFTNLYIALSGPHFATLKEAKDKGSITLNLGLFLNAVIDFLIIAFAIFIAVRQFNRFRPAPEPPSETKECPYCLSQIPVRAKKCSSCTSELPVMQNEI